MLTLLENMVGTYERVSFIGIKCWGSEALLTLYSDVDHGAHHAQDACPSPGIPPTNPINPI